MRPVLSVQFSEEDHIYRVCMQYQQKKYGFKADDLVHALWKKLREQKIEMIKQLELDLEAA